MSLEIAIAAPFRQTGKEKLQKNDFIYFIAIERKWMSRQEAQLLLERALEQGLLVLKENLLIPTFDPSAVEIPLGYRPTTDLLRPPEAYQELLQRIARVTKRPLQEVSREMNELVHERFDGHLRAEAATVILAKKYGVEFRDLLDRLKQELDGRRAR